MRQPLVTHPTVAPSAGSDISQGSSPLAASPTGPVPPEPSDGDMMLESANVQVPLDTDSERRHKARFDFWLGIFDNPLVQWPCVSSECRLSVQEIDQLLCEFFPGQHPISVELLNVYRFVDTCRLANSTWKSSLPASIHAKLDHLVQLVCWTEFREFFNAAILLPFCSLYITRLLVACNLRIGASTTKTNSGANKRLISGKRKLTKPNSSSDTPHFCVDAPSALATAAIRHPVVPRTVRSSACLVLYMSRMYEPPRNDHYAHALRDTSDRPIYYIRVHDLSLVRPCKRHFLLRLIQQHACPENMSSRSTDPEPRSSFGLFRDDFDGSADERRRVRESILSCLRLWHIDEQGHPPDSELVHRLASMLAECTISPQLDIKALRSLSSCFSSFIDRFQLVAHKENAHLQPGPGFQAVARHLVGQNTGVRQNHWNEIAKSVAAVLAGEHAQLLLFHLVHHLCQHSSNSVLAAILKGTDEQRSDDSAWLEQRAGLVQGLVDAFVECNKTYSHLFNGQTVDSDLNQSRSSKLDHIRLGWDLSSVLRESKGRKAKHRKPNTPASSALDASDLASLVLEDQAGFVRGDQQEDDEDDEDDEAELEHSGGSPSPRRRRTNSGPGAHGFVNGAALNQVGPAPSDALANTDDVIFDDIPDQLGGLQDTSISLQPAPLTPTAEQLALVVSPGLARRGDSLSAHVISAALHNPGTQVPQAMQNPGSRWSGLPPYSPETTWSESDSSGSSVALPFGPSSIARGLQQTNSLSLESSIFANVVRSMRPLTAPSSSGRGDERDGDGNSQYCRVIPNPFGEPNFDHDQAQAQPPPPPQQQQQGDRQQQAIAGATSVSGTLSDMEICADSHSTFEVHRRGADTASTATATAMDPQRSHLGFGTPAAQLNSLTQSPVPYLGLPRSRVMRGHDSSPIPDSDMLATRSAALDGRHQGPSVAGGLGVTSLNSIITELFLPGEHHGQALANPLASLDVLDADGKGESKKDANDRLSGRSWPPQAIFKCLIVFAATVVIFGGWCWLNRGTTFGARVQVKGIEEVGGDKSNKAHAPLTYTSVCLTAHSAVDVNPLVEPLSQTSELESDADGGFPIVDTSLDFDAPMSLANFASSTQLVPLELPSTFCSSSSSSSNEEENKRDMHTLTTANGGEGVCWVNVAILQMMRLTEVMYHASQSPPQHEDSNRTPEARPRP